jgi:CheY-like chemotaxis protein
MAIEPTSPTRPTGVLVVEDEAVIRLLAVDTLTEAGYAVMESPHANHAADILAFEAESVHILFSDIDMPGTMTGLDLARLVRQQWPWIAVILTSGKMVPARHEMPSDTRFLPKPYSLEQMLTDLQELAAI